MKKLLLMLIMLAPLLVMGQRVYTDTLTAETDTIIRFRVYDANFTEGWYFYADTLEGTLDATIEIVVANDLSENGYPGDPSLVPDSLFVLFDSGLVDTLSAVGPYAFQYRYIPFDYIGVRFTLNNVTKWFIPYKRISKSQNK